MALEEAGLLVGLRRRLLRGSRSLPGYHRVLLRLRRGTLHLRVLGEGGNLLLVAVVLLPVESGSAHVRAHPLSSAFELL